MLKMTKVELEKISDPDKYMLFEQIMRGGVSYINKRYRETSKNKHIFYLDVNNLYGCAMRQYDICLLIILNGSKTDKIEQKSMRIKNNSSNGYVLEVDLEYPQELNYIHNDYPLASEKINIPKE